MFPAGGCRHVFQKQRFTNKSLLSYYISLFSIIQGFGVCYSDTNSHHNSGVLPYHSIRFLSMPLSDRSSFMQTYTPTLCWLCKSSNHGDQQFLIIQTGFSKENFLFSVHLRSSPFVLTGTEKQLWKQIKIKIKIHISLIIKPCDWASRSQEWQMMISCDN